MLSTSKLQKATEINVVPGEHTLSFCVISTLTDFTCSSEVQKSEMQVSIFFLVFQRNTAVRFACDNDFDETLIDEIHFLHWSHTVMPQLAKIKFRISGVSNFRVQWKK